MHPQHQIMRWERIQQMYQDVLGACVPAGAVAAVCSLPNTGSNVWLTVALAVAAGLLTWAVLYKKRMAREQ